MHGDERRVELRNQVGAGGRGNGVLLLIKLLAGQDQVVGIAQRLLGGQLAQEHHVQRAVAHINDSGADGGVGDQVFLGNHAGIDQRCLRPRLEGRAALHTDSQAGEISSRANRARE